MTAATAPTISLIEVNRTALLKSTLALAKIMHPSCPHPDMTYWDLVSAGWMGLERAEQLFKPEMNVPFRSYACFWIRYSMQRAIQRWGRVNLRSNMKHIVSFYGEHGVPDTHNFDGKDFTITTSLWELLSELDEVSAKIVILKDYYGYNSKDVGRVMGMNPKEVTRIEEIAIKKIREFHGGKNNSGSGDGNGMGDRQKRKEGP